MPSNENAFHTALELVLSLDPTLMAIILLSLQVSLSAVLIAALIALPLGAALALWRFPCRGTLIVILNAFMGLPPVVAGLAVYLMLSRAGPLGSLGLLFTPSAMVIAQVLLVLPIIAALSRQMVEELLGEYREQLHSFGLSRLRMMPTLLWDARFGLTTVVLAGFGRASAEVGAVLIVGGNIDGVTRVMTTAIALETNRGNLPLALGLGLVLLCLVAMVNGAAYLLGESAKRRLG
ncbi:MULTISPECIES: ABC transporter permease [Halomonadaceae]|uniref:ABC transporter permease n=1 Tax=Halomonadaceae TaxID=28256 RepID=UPI00159B7C89|nr:MULTISPECIES: ABC transporter permease [Halomonas]QJQ94646.1 ABC transporter permease [Halomonas sp. PA5]